MKICPKRMDQWLRCPRTRNVTKRCHWRAPIWDRYSRVITHQKYLVFDRNSITVIASDNTIHAVTSRVDMSLSGVQDVCIYASTACQSAMIADKYSTLKHICRRSCPVSFLLPMHKDVLSLSSSNRLGVGMRVERSFLSYIRDFVNRRKCEIGIIEWVNHHTAQSQCSCQYNFWRVAWGTSAHLEIRLDIVFILAMLALIWKMLQIQRRWS